MKWKYPVGTILKGNRKGGGYDNNQYKITSLTKTPFEKPSYTVVDIKDGKLHTNIDESTIDKYDTHVPNLLDDRLFEL